MSQGPSKQFILSQTFVPVTTLEGHTKPVTSIASDDNTARIWNTADGNLIHTLKGHTSFVQSAACNPTGDTVVTASYDTTAKIWDVETGNLIHTLQGHTDVVNSAACNPTGDKVITASDDKTARLWGVEHLIKNQKSLTRDITLHQAVILNFILETMKVKGIVKALGNKAFIEGTLQLPPKEITFNFNQHPHLWNAYEALPEKITDIFDP